MSSDEIYFWWFVWLAIGATIVVAAAALLITIILLARRIAKLAGVALLLARYRSLMNWGAQAGCSSRPCIVAAHVQVFTKRECSPKSTVMKNAWSS